MPYHHQILHNIKTNETRFIYGGGELVCEGFDDGKAYFIDGPFPSSGPFIGNLIRYDTTISTLSVHPEIIENGEMGLKDTSSRVDKNNFLYVIAYRIIH